MPEQQPWTNNPQVLTYARVLRALVSDFSESDAVEAGAIANLLDLQPDDVGAAFDALARDELVTALPMSAADSFTSVVALKSTGRARVSEWDAAATASGLRRACRSALLAWMDTDDSEGVTSSEDFNGTTLAHFTGTPFERRLVRETARELVKIGLVGGTPTMGGPVLRPRLTTEGTTVVDQFGGDVSRWQAGPGASPTTITVTGSQGVNVANASPGAEQRAHVQTSASEGLERLANALETMLSASPDALAFDPEDLVQAYALVPDLRAAAETVEENPGRARRALSALGDITKEGTGSALGSALWALSLQVASALS